MSELNRLMLRQLAWVKRRYQAVAPRMKGLPLCHPDLRIDMRIGGWCEFRAADGFEGRGLLAGIVTPWCINALLLPLAWPLSWSKRVGAELTVQLPAGRFVMLANEGGYLSFSLMAAPRQLADQMAAARFIEEALALLKRPERPQAEKPQRLPEDGGVRAMRDKSLSRRGVLDGA